MGLARIVLTLSGQSTQTYTMAQGNRILDIKYNEGTSRQSAEVFLDNTDGVVSAIAFKGYKGIISGGANTSSGDEYSPKPPLWVVGQQNLSWQGRLACMLSMSGVMNFLESEGASDFHAPDDTDTDTVKTILTAIANATLTVYNHAHNFTITYDSEDALIDAFQPKDSFRIAKNESRLSAMKKLLSYTKNVMRVEDDGEIHILVPRRTEDASTWAGSTAYALNDMVLPTTPNNYYYVCTTAGTSAGGEPTWPTTIDATVADNDVVWTVAYHYEYELGADNHVFWALSNRQRLVIPYFVQVDSHPSDGDDYTGTATDADTATLVALDSTIGQREYITLRLSGNAQAASIAAARIAHYQLDAEKGSVSVPMNFGAEIYDYVHFIDSRDSDRKRTGNIGFIQTHWSAQTNWEMTIGFGRVGFGLAGTAIPQLAGTTGPPSLASIITMIENMWTLINSIINFLETGLENPLEGYIYIDTAGDIVCKPNSGAYLLSLYALAIGSNQKFGLLLASSNARLFWHDSSGTYDHVFAPETDGKGKLGDQTFQWGEGHFKERLNIPVGADKYD